MKKKGKFLVIGIIAVVAVTSSTMPKMLQSSIPSIYYVTPNKKNYKNIVNCSGTVQSSNVQAIYLETSSVIDKVNVNIGDTVQEGDVIATVNLDKTKIINSSAYLLLHEMINDTLGSFSITQPVESVDWESLASSYGLSATVIGGGIEGYSQQIKGLMSDAGINSIEEANIFSASIIGESIYAPISGVITDISIQSGSSTPAGKSIITIADNNNYKVIAAVSESDISKIKISDIAKVRGVGFSKIYTGKVVNIFPTARKTISGTTTEIVVDVEISLDSVDDELRSGFSSKVEITGGEDYDLLTVPYEAIRQDENNEEYVYIYENGKIKKTLVLTGKELTNEVQIIDGLSKESIVVYNPNNIKQEGAIINIKGRADVY